MSVILVERLMEAIHYTFRSLVLRQLNFGLSVNFVFFKNFIKNLELMTLIPWEN